MHLSCYTELTHMFRFACILRNFSLPSQFVPQMRPKTWKHYHFMSTKNNCIKHIPTTLNSFFFIHTKRNKKTLSLLRGKMKNMSFLVLRCDNTPNIFKSYIILESHTLFMCVQYTISYNMDGGFLKKNSAQNTLFVWLLVCMLI